MNDKIKDIFRNYVGYLAVSLICAAYIATSFLQLEESGKTVGEIIADGILAFLLGVLINRIFCNQGLMTGSREEIVLRTSKLHGEIVERIYPHMDRLEDWCEKKNEEALMQARKQYLSRHGMRYSEHFDEDGVSKEFVFLKPSGFRRRVIEWLRYRRFRRAQRLKLTRINAGLLISDSGDPNDPFFMGRSKTAYVSETTEKDVISKILIGIIVGYYCVSMLTNFSIANLIWTVLQVGIFLTMGVITMQKSIIYVTDEYRGRIIKKIDLLQRFEITMKKEDGTYEHYHKEPDRQLSERGRDQEDLPGSFRESETT